MGLEVWCKVWDGLGVAYVCCGEMNPVCVPVGRGNYFNNGLDRDYGVYIGVILGEWKIKWKLLHYNRVYI